MTTFEPTDPWLPDIGMHPPTDLHSVELFDGAVVVQLVGSDDPPAVSPVRTVHSALVRVDAEGIAAIGGPYEWTWLFDELLEVVHGTSGGWTVLVVPNVPDFGVGVADADVARFRATIDARAARWRPRHIDHRWAAGADTSMVDGAADLDTAPVPAVVVHSSSGPAAPVGRARRFRRRGAIDSLKAMNPDRSLAGLSARSVSAWFGERQVLDRVTMEMPAGQVTALIGPSGCGKSTFLRILNRMHEMIPSVAMAGAVFLDGHDIYERDRKLTDARREIGMVFQKPNPFPAMSIYDNVVASLRLTGTRVTQDVKDELVESCLAKAGLWTEVRDRLRQPGGGLSGGQQQRLCIARALAIRPRILLMDEPCSALDPTSTRRIEETIRELVTEVTIVIVTHNMQQAARVSDQCAFFLAEHGTPGAIVEHGPTSSMFGAPQDPRTSDYVNGRFG